MKRILSLLLALALALPLTGCARKPTWRFVLDTRRGADDYTARSGTLLSWYSWKLPYLALVSGDAAPGEEPPEELAAVRDAFNGEMENARALLLEEYAELERLAIDAYVNGGADAPLGTSIEVEETYQTKRLLSVRAKGYADQGGARPWAVVRCWAFDLETGGFVQWYDLAKDPDALRAALAAEAIRQAREQGVDKDFFEGWEDEIERFEGCAAYFGEDALTVIFGEQLLGPRTAGMPEFTVAYERLSKYWNDYGKQLLKKEG